MEERSESFDRSTFYGDYSAHKRWLSGRPADDVDRYSLTFRKLGVRSGAAILEIGFGQGYFLDWAKRNGYRVEGVEILPEMVDHARAKGHIVHLGPISGLDNTASKFDLLAAFDVVEHLTLPEIIELLQSADRLLSTNGKIVLQFPNAGSPFSALYQTGDVTHQCALSVGLLEQICRGGSWHVAQFFNSRVTSRRPLKILKWKLAHLLRDVLELIFGFVYYGARCPLDPNIIVVLERAKGGWTDGGASSRAHAAG